MNTLNRSRPTLAAGAVIALALCAVQAIADDGLEPVNVPGFDHAFIIAGNPLAGYDKLFVDQVKVDFAKGWPPKTFGHDVRPADVERIREKVATAFRREFVRTLKRSRFAVVGEPGAGVLRVTANIQDLYLNAPYVIYPGRTTSYARSIGKMTLNAELRDSLNNKLLSRAIDEREDPDTDRFEAITDVQNLSRVGQFAERWAHAIRGQLDVARVKR